MAYDKLSSLLLKTSLLNDIKKMSPDAQTSCLEGFHATLNYWHPKMICYSWLGSLCRYVYIKTKLHTIITCMCVIILWAQRVYIGVTSLKFTYDYSNCKIIIYRFECSGLALCTA